jgi:site-specific DNA recombinase
MNKPKPENEKIRAAIYCRVSTIGQSIADYSSLNAQKDQLEAYCKGRGWVVTKEYIETKSGKDLERPEIQQLLLDAEAQLFDVAVATKIDRFSRSIIDFYNFSKRLSDLDIDVVSATQQVDTTSSGGKFMLAIFLAFAEFERNIISERTKESKEQRAKHGLFSGGHIILGYDNTNGKLTVNDTEKELVNRIFEYYLQEKSAGAVATRLNKEGYRAKTRITKKGVTQGGALFTKASILRTLRNKSYLGFVPHLDNYYQGIHQPIVDEKIFNEVQKRLEISKNDKQVNRRIKSPLTLLGITKCGLCGSSLTSQSAKSGKHIYYKCSKKIHGGASSCPSKDLPADVLENCIYDLMGSILTEDEFFEAIYNQIKFNNQGKIEELDKDLKDLRSNKTKFETQRTNLLNAIKEGTKLGAIKSVEEDLERIGNDIAFISIRIKNLERDRELAADQKINKQGLRRILFDYVKIYPGLTSEEKNEFNRLLFQEIISNFNQNEEDGTLIIKLRGDGKLEKSWNKIKNANLLSEVRTIGGVSSTNLNYLEPSFQTIKNFILTNIVLKCWLEYDFQPILNTKIFYFLEKHSPLQLSLQTNLT